MGKKTRQLTAPVGHLTAGFHYPLNRGAIVARFVRHPRPPVPAYDTIELRIYRRQRNRRDVWTSYMRPDEAMAMIGVLATAVWTATTTKPVRKCCAATS